MKIVYILILLLILLLINTIIETNNIENYEYINNLINREDIYTNNCKEIGVDDYKDIFVDLYEIKPIIFKVKNAVTKDLFIKNIENFKLNYSKLGNSDEVINTILCKDYLLKQTYESEYIYHSIIIKNYYEEHHSNDIQEDNKLINIILKMIDIPFYKNINSLTRCDLFIGKKYTGTHLHNHVEAINYLIYGKKLWLVFSNSKKNRLYIESNGFTYTGKFKENVIQFFNNHYKQIKKYIEDLYIFIQKENECVYIPEKYYHIVINLEDCGGFIYDF